MLNVKVVTCSLGIFAAASMITHANDVAGD